MTERVWAGLVRVSNVGKRDRNSDTFHADSDQVDEIEREVQRLGDRVEFMPAELDVSGGRKLENRPSMMQAIEGVESGRYAGVIVSYLSRFGRSLQQQLRAWDRIEGAGGRVICIRENINTTTAAGRLQRNLLLSIADHERDQHGETFDRRRRVATEAGIWQRRQTPLGYDKGSDRRLVPNGEADIVRWAFDQRAKGTALLHIARELGMTPSGARYLLKNEVYRGVLSVGKYTNPEAHPALVTPEQFRAAQRTVARPARSGGSPALLAGLVRCSGCGHKMTRTPGTTVSYACPTNHSGERCPGPAHVSVRLLDDHVEKIAFQELEQLTVTANTGDTAAKAMAALADAEAELTAYLSAVSASTVGKDAFAAGAKTRTDAVSEARTELDAAEATARALPYGKDAVKAWDGLDVQEKNVVLRGMLEAVIVAPSGRGRKVPLTDRVRVLAKGAPVDLPNGKGGRRSGIVPIPLPDLNTEGVLRVLAGQD